MPRSRSTIVKALLSAVAVAGLVVSLAACSTSATTANGCAVTASGSKSDAVKVTGDFGKNPKVTFGKPLSATQTERTVVIAGKGRQLTTGDTANVNYAIFNAANGKQLYSSDFGTGQTEAIQLDKTRVLVGFYKALNCSTVGSRIEAVIPPSDGLKDQGEAQGVGPKESLIFIADVVSAAAPPKVLDKPDSTFPTVTFDASGAPTIVMPNTAPPTDLKLAYLKKGTGAKVKATDSLKVNYSGALWANGTVFDSSWKNGAPAPLAANGVIPGFSAALVGQRVGSKVIAIIPPAEGYGATPPEGSGISATDTLVFVIDILSIS